MFPPFAEKSLDGKDGIHAASVRPKATLAFMVKFLFDWLQPHVQQPSFALLWFPSLPGQNGSGEVCAIECLPCELSAKGVTTPTYWDSDPPGPQP